MEKYIINGGKPIGGEVLIGGAKNAVLGLIPAAILAKGVVTIDNVPNISDVEVLADIIRAIGGKVDYNCDGKITIDSTNINGNTVSEEFAKALRASYYFLGVFLASSGEGIVAMPGGCDFGVRPINEHIKGFEALGAVVDIKDSLIAVKAENLTGSYIKFDTVSVGATINVILAAVKAKGLTVLDNVAKEPHIVDVCNFLNLMGADIKGAGTDTIKINGVSELKPANYSVIPDQIEAGSYMALAGLASADITIKNVIPKHLEAITAKLLEAGSDVIEGDDWVRVIGKRPINPIKITTAPHPGFPTDMQPQMATFLCLSESTSIVSEGVWDNRLRYTNELKKMGANIEVDGTIAVIHGVEKLHGAEVKATDLRGGMAVIMAGIVAEGVTTVTNIEYVERGYENILTKLGNLGADIKKV